MLITLSSMPKADVNQGPVNYMLIYFGSVIWTDNTFNFTSTADYNTCISQINGFMANGYTLGKQVLNLNPCHLTINPYLLTAHPSNIGGPGSPGGPGGPIVILGTEPNPSFPGSDVLIQEYNIDEFEQRLGALNEEFRIDEFTNKFFEAKLEYEIELMQND